MAGLGLVAANSLGIFDGSTLDVSSGAVALGNGLVAAGQLTVGSDATLTGDAGRIDGGIVNAGLIDIVATLPGESAGAVTVTGTLINIASIEVGGALAIMGDLTSTTFMQMDSGAALAVGGNLSLSNTGTLQIGAGAALVVSGTLDVQGALTAPSGAFEITAGALDASYGSIDIGGATTLTIAGLLTLGGSFAATDAQITAGSLRLVGTVSLDGGTLVQTGPGANTLEGGTLSLLDGATWTASQLDVGHNPQYGFSATFATLKLAARAGGSGGTLAVAGGLTVGQDGVSVPFEPWQRRYGAVGSLIVTAGGSVSAADLVLASDQGVSTVVVSGSGVVVLGTATAIAGAVVAGGDATITADIATIHANLVLDGGLTEQATNGYAGHLTISGSLAGHDTIVVTGGPSISPGILGVTSTLEIGDAQGFTGHITLEGGSSLILDTTVMPSGEIDVQSNGIVDLRAVAYEAFQLPLYDAATGLLAVGSATLDVGTNHTGADFTIAADAAGGTDVFIVAPNPCYAAGTRIATPDGEVPAEALRPGDKVLTLGGAAWTARPVRWVGQFAVDLDRHPAPENAAPIRIRAHAFAPDVPTRDLRLSPDHAVLVDGALMQAQALVNGATIVREPPVGRVTYVHVELDRHAVLLAEGLPAESYLDTGNRAAFAGESGARALFADLSAARTWTKDACAPLMLAGPLLAAAHARLFERALALGHRVTSEPTLRVLADDVPVMLRRDGALDWRALLPAGARHIRLCSRDFMPSEVSPAAEDHRRLGLAVVSLRVGGRTLPAHVYGDGWHAAEDGWRWTNGDATVRLDPYPHAAWLHIRATEAGALYWDQVSELARRVG